jgi:HlyD family secretion protein
MHLIPGMPAELFFPTANRTMLSYLIKPLSDQVQRAFREE